MADFRYTSEAQLANARFIYQFFNEQGWTSESITGMLGNMHAESGIVADIDEREGGGGYGLVQWTPKSKLVDWANEHNLDYTALITQCKRIQWELENGYQFNVTETYPMTFKEFSTSTKDPAYLAMVFLYNYERPYDLDQPQRGDYAAGWYYILVTRGDENNGQTENTYTVKSVDTLSDIAAKFNTTVAVLQALNNIKDPDLIMTGQTLQLPDGTSDNSTSTYTVRPGDTLSDIAVKFNTTVAVLQALNNIKDADLIMTGQTLQLLDGTSNNSTNTYTVKSGDTLSDIASKFNTTVAVLQALNNIKDADLIIIGQTLQLPDGTMSNYTVKSGDTLSDIAAKFNTTVAVLQSLNNIKDADLIIIGQALKLPDGASKST